MIVSKKNAVSSFVIMFAVISAAGCEADDGDADTVTDMIHIPLCIPGGAHSGEDPAAGHDAAMHTQGDAAMHMGHDAGAGDAAMHEHGDAATHMDEDAGEHAGHMMTVDVSGHSHSSCGLQENCEDVLTLAEGLVVDGMHGKFSVEIVSNNALSKNSNHWMVKVLNAEDEQVTDVSVTVSTWSNDCMHVGPTAPEEVSANDQGLYMLMPVTAHGGPWEVRLSIASPSER